MSLAKIAHRSLLSVSSPNWCRYLIPPKPRPGGQMSRNLCTSLMILALSAACQSEPIAHQADATNTVDTTSNLLTCADLKKLNGAEMICQIKSKPCTVETVMNSEAGCQAHCADSWFYPSDTLEWSSDQQITVHSPWLGTYWCSIVKLPSK